MKRKYKASGLAAFKEERERKNTIEDQFTATISDASQRAMAKIFAAHYEKLEAYRKELTYEQRRSTYGRFAQQRTSSTTTSSATRTATKRF